MRLTSGEQSSSRVVDVGGTELAHPRVGQLKEAAKRMLLGEKGYYSDVRNRILPLPAGSRVELYTHPQYLSLSIMAYRTEDGSVLAPDTGLPLKIPDGFVLDTKIEPGTPDFEKYVGTTSGNPNEAATPAGGNACAVTP